MKAEYYYIDFKDLEIYSWEVATDKNGYSKENELDKANILIGNYFKTYQDAKQALKTIINKQSIS